MGFTTWEASLETYLAFVDTLRTDMAADPSFGFELPWPTFLRCMRMATPQSAGPRVQNRLAADNGWTVIPSSVERGDVVDGDGRYFEVKVTFLTPSNLKANFVQIRPHQLIDGYHLLVIEADYTVTHLVLSKEQMDAELLISGESSHGTASAVVDNATREWSIRIRWGKDVATTARWRAMYQVPWVPQV